MVVLPYYLHDYKKFGRLTILGEFLAIAAVIMCMLFMFVDLGQPLRVLNVILHSSFNSVVFYDMIVLSGYLFLNLLIGWTVLGAEREEITPARFNDVLVVHFQSHGRRRSIPSLRTHTPVSREDTSG